VRRRDFIKIILGSAAALPYTAHAQQSALPVIGFVNSASPKDHAQHLAAFLTGLREAGYIEGRNVAIEYRWADHQNDRLPAMVADLVRRRVDVIVATTTAAALAAKVATTTIPIVFETGSNPDELGLLGQDNITGVAQLDVAVAPIRLQLLHQLVPKADTFALLVNQGSPTLAETTTRAIKTAAQIFGLKLHVLNASTERDFDMVFAHIVELRVGGLVIGSDPFFVGQQKQLAALAVRYGVPTVFVTRGFVAAGGLMSYGGNFFDAYREAGAYVARLLKGEKPQDLPVQRGTKVELFINRKSAKTLGLKIPDSLNLGPDELIE
jgi:putative tryptophan/tyrosine transport system substrate-binding protein